MNAVAAWVDRNSLYIALLAAWVAMLGSLYFSEVAGFAPCTLCWYQRILMYPLTLLLAVGLLRQDENLPILVLPFSVVGLGFATYHYLLEKTDLFLTSTACQAGVSCTTVWINWFGFVTIPFLSLVGFLTITLMAAIALQAGQPVSVDEAPSPWLPVTGIVMVTLAAYLALASIGYPMFAAAEPFTVIDVGEPLAQSRVGEVTVMPALASDQRELVATGTRLFREACASCHGQQGEGVANLGTPLVASAFIRTRSDEELRQFIRTGRAANASDNQSGIAMPPSGGRPDLTDMDLLAIIYYLRTE